ncbi:MAG: hypothetical protein V1887_02720 [Candidatus Aenigmatarchaeota archaeon]
MSRRKQPWFYYFQIAFFFSVGFFLYLKLGFPGEWVEGLAIGLIVAGLKPKLQKILTPFFLLAVIIAAVFDPILKPWLDAALHTNTVSGLWFSIFANVPFFLFYLGGLRWGKRMLGKMKK